MDLHCCETTEKEITACVDKTLLEDRILKKMLESENRCVPNCNVRFCQREVTESMTEIVGGWMMEVSRRPFLNFKYLAAGAICAISEARPFNSEVKIPARS